MIRAKVAYLIAEDPAAHGVLEDPQETQRMVYCTEKSVGQSEAYQARGTGLNPEKKLILRHAFEYHGEKLVEYGGERWRVIRTYRDADSMELTVQREDGNAAEAAEAAEPAGEDAPAEPAVPTETAGEAAPADEPDAPETTDAETPATPAESETDAQAPADATETPDAQASGGGDG